MHCTFPVNSIVDSDKSAINPSANNFAAISLRDSTLNWERNSHYQLRCQRHEPLPITLLFSLFRKTEPAQQLNNLNFMILLLFFTTKSVLT